MPGLPLAFLDGRIKVGNALLGVTPRLLEAGIPDGAFKPIEGDDPKVASSLRRQNEKETGARIQDTLDFVPGIRVSNARLGRAGPQALRAARHLAGRHPRADQGVPGARGRPASCGSARRSPTPGAPLSSGASTATRRRRSPPSTLRRLDAGKPLPRTVADELDQLVAAVPVLPLAPGVPRRLSRGRPMRRRDHNAGTGWQGGFSCVVGNPPWERVKLQEQEFFATSQRRTSRRRKTPRPAQGADRRS